MSTPLNELLAREWTGELTEAEAGDLADRCARSPDAAASRDRFRAAMHAMGETPLLDPPGPALHRAYAIPSRERGKVSAADAGSGRAAGARGLLRIVYDNLPAAPGLRGTVTERRHLLLESHAGAIDVFIEADGDAFAVELLTGATDSVTGVRLEGEGTETALILDGDAWRGRIGAGRYRLVVLVSQGGRHGSELFEVN